MWVSGVGLRVYELCMVLGLECITVYGFGFRVYGFGFVTNGNKLGING